MSTFLAGLARWISREALHITWLILFFGGAVWIGSSTWPLWVLTLIACVFVALWLVSALWIERMLAKGRKNQ